MCERVTSEDSLMLVCCPDRYKTQRLCDKAVNDYVAALKLIHDRFVTNKMLEKLDNVLHVNDDKPFYSADFW